MIQRLRPEEVWHPKRGAPYGNRNAYRTGRHTAGQRDLRHRIADWRRRARAALGAAENTPAAISDQQETHAEARIVPASHPSAHL
jgi:hypothetical protein